MAADRVAGVGPLDGAEPAEQDAPVSLTPPLQKIVAALDGPVPLSPAALAEALRPSLSIDDVAPWIKFDSHNYMRNLVDRGDRWEVRLLCWRPGQTTSLHGHGGSACAFRILRGSAVESVLGRRDRVWAPGDVVEESSVDLIHQVGNAAADPMLTLHAYSPPLPIDAPSKREGREVVVVGGGFSGIAMALHLLKRGDSELRVTLVERGPWLGRGVAYGVDSEIFRLNVPASRMSIDPEDPGDFVRWAGAESTPDAFLQRSRYGAYVVARFGEAIRAAKAKLRLVRAEAVGVEDARVRLADGRRLPAAEAIVLATGISPRVAPSELPDDPRIVDAWDECALATLPRAGNVLILGSGLSAIDVTTLLKAHGFQGTVTILSRRGLLPRPHLAELGVARSRSDRAIDDAPRSLRALLRWGRAFVADVERRGEPWQHAIDALHPHVTQLWRGLRPGDRARFVRTVRPYWDVLRHRAPFEAHALIERWRADGRLEIVAGSIAGCEPAPSALHVLLRLAGGATRPMRFDAIVRCIGPALGRSEADTPLVQALIASGRAAPDPAGLGIVTDEHGRVVDDEGRPSDRLLALGALRRASSWETTAVPDISVHAAALAKRIVAR